MDAEVKPGCELRVDVKPGSRVKFVVVDATAEINGQELLMGKWYTVQDTPFFLFTYSGCLVKLGPGASFSYESSETNLPQIFNLFTYLRHTKKGNILIVGNGRNTLANILTNYYVRLQEQVMYVDLGVNSSTLVFPGTISAGIVSDAFSPVESPSVSEKISFFFGSLAPSDNPELFSMLLTELLMAVRKKNHLGPRILVGDRSLHRGEIEEIVSGHGIDMIISVGDEKLVHELSSSPDPLNSTGASGSAESPVEKAYVQGFSGYTPRDAERRRMQITESVREYFHGKHNELSPATITLRVESPESILTDEEEAAEPKGDIRHRIVQVGDEFMAPMSALPLGTSRRKNSTAVSDCAPEPGAILAISSSDTRSGVPAAPVLGYLSVLEVISDTQVKVLSPQPKLPPKRFLVQGRIRVLL